jgi:lipopolysaccharide/colanic/teichoic acid biosynthesis glycosyltransferase
MENYFYYTYNLSRSSRFLKFPVGVKNAIYSVYKDSLLGFNNLEELIINESNVEVLSFIKQYIDIQYNYKKVLFSSYTTSFVDDVDYNDIQAIIDFKNINNVENINGLLGAVNSLLPNNGILIGRIESYTDRKNKIIYNYGPVIGQALWLCDFIINRIVPRLPLFDDIYNFVTEGRFHAISVPEMLGRLIYCGFDIIDFKEIRGLTYFAVKKVTKPCQFSGPSYYPVIRLHRVGKDGKMIRVYKFRTMHPYSEYLQQLILKYNGHDSSGKLANDWRITRWGKLIRKFWLDELPQIINVLKGEMKLVGIRPLSWVRFQEMPPVWQKERIKYKPGLVAPYVALCMPDEKGNIEAEKIYINEYLKNPFITDLKYLLKAIYNILINRIRAS